MKIAYSPYVLEGERNRPGALLKWEFDNGTVGYSDCNPCVERGDLPIEKQIAQLKAGQWTPLTTRAKHIATLDADARARHINLFDGLKIPSSNYLIMNLASYTPRAIEKILERGFTRIKVKISRDFNLLKPLVQAFGSQIKWRLDFNEKLTLQEFSEFLEASKPYRDSFDYFEDPTPFMWEEWQLLQQNRLPLACDYRSDKAAGHPDAASVLVVKPAIQNEHILGKDTLKQKWVVTTYLDHPRG